MRWPWEWNWSGDQNSEENPPPRSCEAVVTPSIETKPLLSEIGRTSAMNISHSLVNIASVIMIADQLVALARQGILDSKTSAKLFRTHELENALAYIEPDPLYGQVLVVDVRAVDDSMESSLRELRRALTELWKDEGVVQLRATFTPTGAAASYMARFYDEVVRYPQDLSRQAHVS